MTRFKTLISTIVSMVMLMVVVFGISPAAVIAEDDYSLPEMRLLSENEVSPFVDYANAVAKGHAGRAYNEEDMNTIVYYNLDGTKTAYFFDQDVKYTDADGNIVDKDIGLKAKLDGYTTKQNDIYISLPNSVTNGIELRHMGTIIKLIPVPDINSQITSNVMTNASADMNANKVSYGNAFGEDTRLEYTPLLNGIKEDIVLEDYNGINTWRFIAQTNGLYAFQDEGGRYYFAQNADAEYKYSLGDVYTYDSDGNFTYGTMTVTPIKAGSQYAVELTVNENFLTNIETVYPVYVDPMITLNGSGVYDAGVYSAVPTSNYSSASTAMIGYDALLGTARVAMRFYGLENSSAFYTYMDYVLDAKLNLYFESVVPNTPVAMHYCNYRDWRNSNATWSTLGNNYLSPAEITFTPTYGTYSLDVTDIVQEWRGDDTRLRCGLLFKMLSESTTPGVHILCMSEYATSTCRPTLEITYSTTLSDVFYPRITVKGGETASIKRASHYNSTSLTFTSADTSIVTTSDDGSVTGISEGTTTVTIGVTYEDGSTDSFVSAVTVSGEYISADAAARGFSVENHAASIYTRHIYAAAIRKTAQNGQDIYTYTSPNSELPHYISQTVKDYLPSSDIVAYVYIYPFDVQSPRLTLTEEDMILSNTYNVDGYMCKTNGVIKKYTCGETHSDTAYYSSDYARRVLTDTKKTALQGAHSYSWNSHFVNGACPDGYNCETMIWPTS